MTSKRWGFGYRNEWSFPSVQLVAVLLVTHRPSNPPPPLLLLLLVLHHLLLLTCRSRARSTLSVPRGFSCESWWACRTWSRPAGRGPASPCGRPSLRRRGPSPGHSPAWPPCLLRWLPETTWRHWLSQSVNHSVIPKLIDWITQPAYWFLTRIEQLMRPPLLWIFRTLSNSSLRFSSSSLTPFSIKSIGSETPPVKSTRASAVLPPSSAS